MLAFLSQKVNSTDTHQYTAVSWNKDTDMFIAGRSDGMVIMRQLDAKTRAAKAAAKGANGDAGKAGEQNLFNHQAPIRSIAWNPRHNIVATGDSEGITTVWKLDPKTGLWSNYMATRAVQRAVLAMQWTKEGDRICIVYETGTVMVGKIDGVKLWSVEQKLARVPAWSTDGEIVLVGTSLGQIFIYDKAANNIGLVTLTSKPEEKPSEQPLVDIKWYYPNDGITTYHPVLAIAFEDGKLYLLQGEEDHHPIWVNVPMNVVCVEWSADGKSLAIAGRTRKTVAAPEESAQLMVYSLYGKPEYSMRFRSKNLSSISWDSSGQRLAVVLDGTLNFVVIKRPIKFCVFENTLVYSCAKDEAQDALLVMYSLKNEKRVTVKHYTNQRVLCLCGGNDFCVIATRVTAEVNQLQFNLYVLNDSGATINISFTNIEPIFITASDSQIFVASREVVFVWSFRLSGMESVSNKWDISERYFHVDDAHGFIDLKQKRQRLYEVSVDPVCAITASKSVLIVARESGTLVRYSLPQMIWEREYPAILPAARKLGLNKTSSRLLLMNHEGQCVMYALEEIFFSKDAQPVKDVKINLEKRDIWDFMWAEDDPEMFVVNHKTRSLVYRNRDAEEPISNEGYLCKFKDLEIKVGFLDDIIRQAVPTDPPANCIRTLRTKALRETYQLMDSGSLTEAQHFVEMHSHPILWNLLANRALQRLDLDVAELCYIRGAHYAGIQFVGKLRKLKSDHLRKADVAAYFGDHYRAEQEYNDANRADLAADLRRISGDWFRLKEMAVDSENDTLLKESYIGLGNYYYDRQAWPEAIKNYEAARDYAALYKCYMLNGDTQKLEELADILPTGHPLLVQIGRLLGSYGDSVAAARILRKAEQIDMAVEVCTNCYNFQTAAELARTYDLEKYTPATVTKLMNQAIQDQVAGQGDQTSLWSAASLYYNSSLYLEAAKCLYQILDQEIHKKESDYLRLKKLGVLAAIAVEEYRKSNNQLLAGKGARNELLQEETKSADYPFLDNPWRIAEAYNVMLVAQSFQKEADYGKALRAAGTLCSYTDIIDPVHVYSMIALSATSLKRWDVANEAILRIANMPSVDASIVKEMEEFADDLFAKHSPKDVDLDDPLPSPLCLNCGERLPVWDVKCTACQTKYPICMATGSPITEAEVWQCEVCHHHSAASAALNRTVCALCHTAR